MPQLEDAHRRHCAYYVAFGQSHQPSHEQLDREFTQIQIAFDWLARQSDPQPMQQLLSLIGSMSAYLQHRHSYRILLSYCERGLRAAQSLGADSGWLYLLLYEAHWAIGEWDAARSSAQLAIDVSRASDPATHARAVLAKGRLQFNRGEYRIAMETLAEAETLLAAIPDDDGVADIKAERAAYFLNRDEPEKALPLYLEVDQLRRRVHPGGSSHHTLLMLGVVYRRLKDHRKAIESLTRLIQSGEASGSLSAIATGTHHLAWVYFDTGELAKARQAGERAKELYERIGDPRGGSDADEQLGLIALVSRDYPSAQAYLERSLAVRQQLGNQQGAASSLHRLARLHLHRRNWLLGIRHLWASLALYWRLGVLSRRRVMSIFKSVMQ